MIVSSRSWHIAHTASSSLLLNEDDDGHFLSFVLICVDIVECELAHTAHNFGWSFRGMVSRTFFCFQIPTEF